MKTPGVLPPPPEDFNQIQLPISEIDQHWFRSHPVDRAPEHYGRNVRNRFDDPLAQYGVLYIAEDHHGAFVETFGQLVSKVKIPRRITTAELRVRAVSELVCGRPLRLVDLTGSGLAQIGADSRLFAADHEEARVWSRAIYDHPEKVDGLYYPTRHDPSRKAAALFNESLDWVTLTRSNWLSQGLKLRDILNEYGFALIESQIVHDAVRKDAKQELLF